MSRAAAAAARHRRRHGTPSLDRAGVTILFFSAGTAEKVAANQGDRCRHVDSSAAMVAEDLAELWPVPVRVAVATDGAEQFAADVLRLMEVKA